MNSAKTNAGNPVKIASKAVYSANPNAGSPVKITSKAGYSAKPNAGNPAKVASKTGYSANPKDGIPVKINQTTKDKMGTVKLINCLKSKQKKLKIDITNTKGEKSMKILSNTIKNKQEKSFLGTLESKTESKNKFSTRFIQINLKKKINANKTMLSELKNNDIILIQEPYINKNGYIPDVPKSHKQLMVTNNRNEIRRSAILIPTEMSKCTVMLNGLSNKDIVTLKCEINNDIKVIITSIYMDKEEEVPIEMLEKISSFAKEKKLALIIGSDTNSHSKIWGCSNNQDKKCKRSPKLIDFITKNNLFIENKPEINIPTFDSPVGRSSIDLTITNEKANKLIKNWDIKLNNVSDHNTIIFDMNMGNLTTHTYRSIQDCNWEIFTTELQKHLEDYDKLAYPITKTTVIDHKMTNITKILTRCYEKACPEKERKYKTKIPWWNKELTNIKNKTKKLRRKATKSRSKEDWAKYKDSDQEYNKQIKSAKKQSWKDYCSETVKLKDLAKIPKTNKKSEEQLNCLERTDGSLTTSAEETLLVLADTLFPVDQVNEELTDEEEEDKSITNKRISDILNENKLDTIIKELNQRKTPGEDKLYNEIIQNAWSQINKQIIHIFKHSLLLNHIPNTWKLNKGVIIAKPYKDSYMKPRSFRIISLTSNLQKVLEKAILNYLEDKCNIDKKLTKNQYGFRKNKSTETAIHKLTREIEKAITNNQYAIGIFIDIEGAFDNIKFSSIKKAMIKLDFPPVITNWIINMISTRSIKLEFKGKEIIRVIMKGCPQGGILSPMLWNITLNLLLENSNINPKFIQAFADDMVILVPGIDQKTISTIAKNHLMIIDKWCNTNGLKLSAIKTKVILFRMKGKKVNFDKLIIKENIIHLSKSTKFLGITIDQHLNWTEHIIEKCNKAKKLLFKCRNTVGKNWGLTPERIRWIYLQVVLPQISYSAFVWTHKSEETEKVRKALNSIQRLATLMITGGIFTTPTLALDIMAGIKPIHSQLKITSIKTALRLKSTNDWDSNFQIDNRKREYFHSNPIDKFLNKIKHSNDLDIAPKTRIIQKYKVNPYDDQDIVNIIKSIPSNQIKIYTDGSLLKNNNKVKTGAGVFITRNEEKITDFSIPLGISATIFQCEMYALKTAAKWINNQNLTPQNIYILSDSQAALKALEKQSSKSKLVIETNTSLNNASLRHNITIIKVPAHTGLEGNEKADKLAKDAANKSEGHINLIKNSLSSITNEIKEILYKDQINKLRTANLSDKVKNPMLQILKKYKYNLKVKSKKNLRMLTQILTGHNILNHSRANRKKDRQPFCSYCKNIRETSEHFLGKCQAYINTRIQCFGKDNITIREIIEKNKLQDIIEYIIDTDRLNRKTKD